MHTRLLKCFKPAIRNQSDFFKVPISQKNKDARVEYGHVNEDHTVENLCKSWGHGTYGEKELL